MSLNEFIYCDEDWKSLLYTFPFSFLTIFLLFLFFLALLSVLFLVCIRFYYYN